MGTIDTGPTVAPLSARDRIRAAGARVTPARVRVMEVLSKASGALSHRDIERQAAENPLDRVTLYRVLEWLVAQGFAHKTVDAARISRFSIAVASTRHSRHAHFQCDRCGRVFCLDKAPIARPRLPAGFRFRDAEFSIRGECSECMRRARAGDAGSAQTAPGAQRVL